MLEIIAGVTLVVVLVGMFIFLPNAGGRRPVLDWWNGRGNENSARGQTDD